MAQNIRLIVYPVKDLDDAKVLFGKFLGTEPYVDGPYYVGYKLGDIEVGLDPSGHGVVSYIDVDDIKSFVQSLVSAGATVQQDTRDVGGGLLIAQVKDANGNMLGLRAPK